MLIDLKNHGVSDTFFLVCDGLKGLPEVLGDVKSLYSAPNAAAAKGVPDDLTDRWGARSGARLRPVQ